MLEELKEILKEYSNAEIDLNTDLRTQLDLTSFDIVSLLGDIEEKYGIQFSEEDMTNINTVEDVINYINSKK